MDEGIKKIENEWDSRYLANTGISHWPSEAIVSWINRQFSGLDEPGSIKVLDFGCGNGNNIKFLLDFGLDAFGVDVSNVAIQQARRGIRLSNQKLDLASRLINNSSGNLDVFENDTFDCVIDRLSISQMSLGSARDAVADVRRVLKPGGLYFGIFFASGHPIREVRSKSKRHFYSVEELTNLFERFEMRWVQLRKSINIVGDYPGFEEFHLHATK